MILLSLNVYAQKPVLKFRDHKFKIVQFTDLHWVCKRDYAERNDSTLTLMRDVIREEKPDLVVMTGDIIVSGGAAEGWKQVVRPMEEAKVPFAVTFGNHDTEEDITKQQALEILQQSTYNLTFNADGALSGAGNCSLPVMSDDGKESFTTWIRTLAGKELFYSFDSN